MPSILVTGSTGNVGEGVVRELIRRDACVRSAVRPGRTTTPLPGVETVAFDFEQPTTFAAALQGVDRVFLMRPPHMSDAAAMRPFIDAMAAFGVRHVVFLSVQGAGTNPFVPHHGIERMLKRSRVGWTLLRPSFFMQNLSTTHLDDVRDLDRIIVPAGRGRTNFIDVDDIAEAAAITLTAPGHVGKAYELTGSDALTYSEVAEILSQACGRTISYQAPSAREFKKHMRAAGHASEFITVTSMIYALARFGLAAGTTDELEHLIGRKPTTFAEWAQRNSACFDTGDGESLPQT